MSYRCVIVSNPAHISTRSEQLVVETDERHTVPIEDISALMLESRRATLSAAALSALAATAKRPLRNRFTSRKRTARPARWCAR